MSSIGSVGSGLDIQGLVSQLVAAERAPQAQRLSRIETSARAQLSSLGNISSVLAQLKSAATAFSTSSGFGARTVSLSNGNYLSATAGPQAQQGSYEIEVVDLARAGKISSAPQATASTSLGSGSLTLNVGSASFTVNGGGGPITLEGLRDAINNASDNAGVSASLVTTDDGVRLVLTGRETGASKTLSISGSGDLTAFAAAVTVNTTAANAQVRVDGNLASSSTNTFASVIPGVSFTATKSETDPASTRTTLTVGRDDGAARKQAEAFVTSVNSVLSTVKVATLANPQTGVTSPLTGDALPRSLVSQLRNAIGANVAGQPAGFESLNSVGITFQADGSLKLDATRFDAAMNANPQAVAKLFSGDGSTGKRVVDLVDSFTGANGAITSRSKAINERLSDVTVQREALDRRMERVQATYLAQFTAMEKIVTQLQGTSSFLAGQLAQLPSAAR
ncbi:flagellar filament capping protein FliD [Aquimonas voraii]|uniref:Flagellar hook-associated protein 2 n=1 Tax=Aquimonas voraii TaxID=265719 RepID=A0A1G6YI67_9GAMM|nr:flagellar filament capping protein FliD [Aquimonas voraii]SDD89683.1 flagellar hook-associated protein 2 [Aquimonas voraii]